MGENMERKRAWGLAAFAALLLCIAVHATAAEVLDMQLHEKWASFIVTGSSWTTVRMATEEDETMLALDMYPDRTGRYGGSWELKLLEMLPPGDAADMADLFPLALSGQMRVDRKKTHDVTFHFALEENLLVIRIAGDYHQAFLEEAKKGSMLRIKMGVDDPLYAGFSLDGFTAALNRCFRLVKESVRRDPPHSEYFDEEPPSRPEQKEHEAYFL